MEPSPDYSNSASSRNESGEETHSSCKDSKLNGSLSPEFQMYTAAIRDFIEGTEYFTTEIIGDINEDYFSEEMLDIRYFISGRFFLDKNEYCYRSHVNMDYIFKLEEADEDQ